MKKTIFILFSTLLIISCSSVKTTQKAINAGNYDTAIRLAVKNLIKSKTKKRNQKYIPMLEDAFKKVKQRDEDRIAFLKTAMNPDDLERIYNLYLKLEQRQATIKPLMPLRSTTTGKKATFSFLDYTSDIIYAKVKLTEQLYAKAKIFLKSDSKIDFRRAYDDLNYIESIHPNYNNTRALIEEAHFKGTDFVFVSIKNRTRKIIPRRLSDELLNFDTYGLEDLWTVYHSEKEDNITYDFELQLLFRSISISPEKIKETEFVKEKEIKDGWEYLLDKKGTFVLDSEGNRIKVDKLITVRCELSQFEQFKSATVRAQVKFIDYYSKKVIKSFPLRSQFNFEHSYAKHRGDKRALKKSYRELISLKPIRFPSNEQMVYDAGTDLKSRLKRLIKRNKFRN